ncbi:hypothetical protein DPEC_G00121970 [Dallia pectoralis]|uniref:Uncharacterized protein n=1 Tax=Dallia pectoralis TaxID=75939 RepID=A0ACC2GQH4_DALPE|nr:hypothetical protein DPEC_G00121970 [Dallia pectoralis]
MSRQCLVNTTNQLSWLCTWLSMYYNCKEEREPAPWLLWLNSLLLSLAVSLSHSLPNPGSFKPGPASLPAT